MPHALVLVGEHVACRAIFMTVENDRANALSTCNEVASISDAIHKISIPVASVVSGFST